MTTKRNQVSQQQQQTKADGQWTKTRIEQMFRTLQRLREHNNFCFVFFLGCFYQSSVGCTTVDWAGCDVSRIYIHFTDFSSISSISSTDASAWQCRFWPPTISLQSQKCDRKKMQTTMRNCMGKIFFVHQIKKSSRQSTTQVKHVRSHALAISSCHSSFRFNAALDNQIEKEFCARFFFLYFRSVWLS